MKHFFLILFSTILLSASLSGQTIVQVPSDLAGEGNLNAAVEAAKSSGTLSTTIFQLEPYGYYILTGTIEIPVGEVLTIEGPVPGLTQAESLPQILWTSSGAPATDFIFDCYGDISLTNIWLRYANVAGAQVGSQILIRDNPDPLVQERADFDNVLFDYAPTPETNASGAVCVTADHFVGIFKNCYFKNCIDTHLRYYGRAVSFPYQSTGWHIDSLMFENTTFANIGYVLMHEGGEYSDNVYFNHCTFLNAMMFSLQSGWWYKASVTNSLWVNGFMFGAIPVNDGFEPAGAAMTIDSIANFGHAVPWTEQDRRILFSYNSYYTEQWLIDWTHDNPYSVDLRANRRGDEVPIQRPMLGTETLEFFFESTDFPYMNAVNNFTDTLTNAYDPGFVNPPTNLDSLKAFLLCKWDTNCDLNWAWQPDDGWFQTWPLLEDLSYTNAILQTAGMNGFPLGDLYHWWPTEYSQWEAQADAEHNRIITWRETGNDPASDVTEVGGSLPSDYTLGQNYPNPFNPVTNIEFSVPEYSNVSLKVFNSLGEEVATLVDGPQGAGNYIVTFDGTELSSGIYMYRLESESVSISKKFVLMK